MESNSNIKVNLKQNNDNTQTAEQVLREIEAKTEKQIVDAYKSGKLVNPIKNKDPIKQSEMECTAQSIMQNGAKEFQEKVGRNMSYSEMRAAWG